MRVTILHNISRGAGLGLEAGEGQLVAVFTYDMPLWPTRTAAPGGREEMCEIAFREFNAGTSALARAYRDRRLRSLSTGDVVMIGSSRDERNAKRAFACERAGWQRVQVASLHVLAGDEAEAAVREAYGYKDDEPLGVTVPLEEGADERVVLYGHDGEPWAGADSEISEPIVLAESGKRKVAEFLEARYSVTWVRTDDKGAARHSAGGSMPYAEAAQYAAGLPRRVPLRQLSEVSINRVSPPREPKRRSSRKSGDPKADRAARDAKAARDAEKRSR